jgi:hypothetical protein
MLIKIIKEIEMFLRWKKINKTIPVSAASGGWDGDWGVETGQSWVQEQPEQN